MVAKGTYTSDLSTDEKVLMAVIRAAEHFKRVHSGVFRNFGLSFPQYNVLRVLDASKKGQNKISDVSRIMLVPGANITGIAKRLEKDGFIKKKSIPEDDRVTLLEITPKGKKTLQKIEEEKNQRLELMMKNLAKKEKAALLDMVKRILKNGMLLKKSL
jgi:DNA-binding MarR family transcriptional regulator